MSSDVRVSGNQLLLLLPGKDRARLLACCTLVTLELGEVLNEPGRPTGFVYFPVEGFISLLAVIDEIPSLEVGIVGWEGMYGVHLAVGVTVAPLRALVQGAGTAWRLGAAAFRRELAASVALRRALNRYVYVTMSQIASSAACLQSHVIRPRLARWLLMTQDRAGAGSFYVTHELLADMLGVRRVGITIAAGLLQKEGLIQYSRGALTVLSRTGLEAAACSCYAADRSLYAQVMEPPPA